MQSVLAFFAPSAGSRAFFFIASAAHIALKVLLGLVLAFEDGYGLRSLVTPPMSVMFAGADIVVCFGLAKFLDVVARGRAQRVVHTLALAMLSVFLITNFIVHGYFKSFINRGLLEFNGASSVEITDYAVAGLNGYSISFGTIIALLFAAHVVMFNRLRDSKFLARTDLPFFTALGGAACMAYVGTLSAGQCGFLSFNPAYLLMRSYVIASVDNVESATAAQALAFTGDLKPLHGRYPAGLDVEIAARPKSNVLFVLIESLPFEQTRLASETGGMPILSELAQEGVSFENFRTVFPATSRSFLTYHCGIYPSPGAATITKYRPDYRCESILEGLKQHGYRTGFFTAPMFTYDNLHKARCVQDYDEYQDFLSLRRKARKNQVTAPAVEEEVVADAVVDFIRKDKTKPFFATYFMFWNHAPYRLPFEDISHLKAHERYRRTLEYLDTVLRSLLARLRESGDLENTMVVVTADHGEGFGLHHDNHNHVGHVYEDDVRVPFVIHLPGLGAHVTQRQASNVDFAPTLFRLLGLPSAPSWQGQDVLSVDYAPRPTLLFGRASFTTNALVDGHLKYIEYPTTQERMLFDLSDDPHEQRNLLAERGSEADDYQTLIRTWLSVAEFRAWEVDRTHGKSPD